mgnify:CR=1 FL=1
MRESSNPPPDKKLLRKKVSSYQYLVKELSKKPRSDARARTGGIN